MNGSIFFFPKARRLLKIQRSLARKYNKIGDETKHGHSNMITKYSYSFRVLTSKTHVTKLRIFCHIWIGPHSEFISWKKFNKLSKNGDQTHCNFFLRLSKLFSGYRWMEFANWLTSLCCFECFQLPFIEHNLIQYYIYIANLNYIEWSMNGIKL